jgi:hypothetical protein
MRLFFLVVIPSEAHFNKLRVESRLQSTHAQLLAIN